MVQAGFFHAISFSYRVRILLFFFGGIHGLTISREPNQTTIAFAGSNVTLSWNLILTPEEKTELLEVWFGTWNNNFQMIGRFLKKFATTNGSIVDATENTQKAKRWHWNGDLSRDYTIAYQLTNAQHDDAGDYGIRVRADFWPPRIESKGPFSLAIREPPVMPAVDTRNLTREVVEGNRLNITCRLILEGNPVIVWTKNNIPLKTSWSKYLVIERVKRNESGNYACVSVAKSGNQTSAITTVAVLYAPSMRSKTKVISITVRKGTEVRLTCGADGNPQPTFSWHKNSDLVSSGFNSSWNVSILIVQHTGGEDFARFVCTAKNRVGWDALFFYVQHTRDTRNLTREVVEGNKLNITCRLILEGNPLVVWTKNNIPLKTSWSKYLVIERVKRNESGNYACVSVAKSANQTSAITTVDVLYFPSMRSKTKVISITVRKGTEVRLTCEADGNPQPTFSWHKNSDLVSSGFNSSWNVSILIVQHTCDEDFARFVCTAKNRVGSDALTFDVQHARVTEPHTEKSTEPTSRPLSATQPETGTFQTEKDNDKSRVIFYASISGAVVFIVCCSLLASMIYRWRVKQRKGKNQQQLL